MLRRAIAATLTALAASYASAPVPAASSQSVVRPIVRGVANIGAASAHDAMEEGLAHIAARGTLPATQTAALTQQERMALYLLLSLRRTKAPAP